MRLVLLGLVIAVLVGAAWYGDPIEWVGPERLRSLLEDLGVWGPLVYMFLMTVAVVISPIPSLPLDTAAGAVFGAFWGTVYSVLGAEAGALVSFWIARVLGRKAIAQLLGRDIAFCDLCAERHLGYIIFAARLFPVLSFDLVSYGAGLTRISTRTFALATFLGMIPPTFLFNYLGSRMVAESGLAMLMAGLLVLSFFLVPVWIKRRNPWGLYDRIMQGAGGGRIGVGSRSGPTGDS